MIKSKRIIVEFQKTLHLLETQDTLHEDGHTSLRLEVASDEPLPPPARAGRRGEAGGGRGQGARVHRGARQS